MISPWARGAAFFPFLFAACAIGDPGPARPSRDGWVWLALGLAVSLVCVAGGFARAGRPGVVLAMLGLARALGRPSLARALVAVWIVPLPSQLLDALAPGLAGVVAQATAHAAPWLGTVAQVDAHHVDRIVLVAPNGVLDLFPGDGGLPLAWTLAGVGWFAAARGGAPIAQAGVRAARVALTALPLQIVALATACGLALFGAAAAARALLDHLVVLAAAIALGFVLASSSRAGVRRAEAAG